MPRVLGTYLTWSNPGNVWKSRKGIMVLEWASKPDRQSKQGLWSRDWWWATRCGHRMAEILTSLYGKNRGVKCTKRSVDSPSCSKLMNNRFIETSYLMITGWMLSTQQGWSKWSSSDILDRKNRASWRYSGVVKHTPGCGFESYFAWIIDRFPSRVNVRLGSMKTWCPCSTIDQAATRGSLPSSRSTCLNAATMKQALGSCCRQHSMGSVVMSFLSWCPS